VLLLLKKYKEFKVRKKNEEENIDDDMLIVGVLSLNIDDSKHEKLLLAILLADGHDGLVVSRHVGLDEIHSDGHGRDLVAAVEAPETHSLIGGAGHDQIVVRD
jgi:hypothetical protein